MTVADSDRVAAPRARVSIPTRDTRCLLCRLELVLEPFRRRDAALRAALLPPRAAPSRFVQRLRGES